MSSGNAMRQLEERHAAAKIDLMVWSTKLDLLALSYCNGEVALHRLNWLKVWVLPPPGDEIKVKGIAWRPDAKILAIGYSTNEIFLVDVENKEIINRAQYDAEITLLCWSQDKEEVSNKKSSLSCQKIYCQPRETYRDECSIFLPKLPSLTRTFGPGNTTPEEHIEDGKKINDQLNLNLLFIGLGSGKLCISVFGLFLCAAIDIKNYFKSEDCIILDANISKDFKAIFVVVAMKRNDTDKYKVSTLILNSEILSNNSDELHMLVLKYGQLTSSIDYLNQTLQSIIESWENILIEMDSKLTAYASRVPSGRVSADFLELLMFGTPSPEMGTFLLQDLTERGLKKLGNSIELSYLNIQKLVLKHLHSVGQNLAYYVNELWGLSRCPNYFQILGLNESLVNKAFTSTGSFLIKSTEVQQVIDNSLKKYKTFFRWLYTTILRLSDDRVSSEMNKTSQQDLQSIAEFLYQFEGENGEDSNVKKPKFNLERLGQYLLDKNLDVISEEKNELWTELLEQKHPLISQHPLLIPHHKEMSLVQEIKHLEKEIISVFKHSETFIGQHFKVLCASDFVQVSDSHPKVTSAYFPEEEKFLLAVLDSKSSASGFWFVHMPVHQEKETPKCVNLNLSASDRDGVRKVTDVQFYLPDVLSILLDQRGSTHLTGFVQLPVKLIKDLNSETISTANIENIVDNHVRNIDGITASSFAVSGSRKVSVILSENRKKVKLFEMEAEDEEDEDEIMETTGSFKESDDSRIKMDKTMEDSVGDSSE